VYSTRIDFLEALSSGRLECSQDFQACAVGPSGIFEKRVPEVGSTTRKPEISAKFGFVLPKMFPNFLRMHHVGSIPLRVTAAIEHPESDKPLPQGQPYRGWASWGRRVLARYPRVKWSEQIRL
jgi:hypothetical protein